MLKFLCKLFGHGWKYFIISSSPQKNIRVCRKCMRAQEYKWCIDSFVWMWLVGRTKKGVDKWIKENEQNYFSKEKKNK